MEKGSSPSFRRRPESSDLKDGIGCPYNYGLISNFLDSDPERNLSRCRGRRIFGEAFDRAFLRSLAEHFGRGPEAIRQGVGKLESRLREDENLRGRINKLTENLANGKSEYRFNCAHSSIFLGWASLFRLPIGIPISFF